MITFLFLILCVVCVYVAVRWPAWYWTAFFGPASWLQMVADLMHQSYTSIDVGPIAARSTDPALLGVLVGTIYHARRERDPGEPQLTGMQFLTRRPVGTVVLLMLAFMALKTVYCVLFRSDDIFASRVASHALGGLVAAVGDVRDQLLPFLPIVYAYAARQSRQLKHLGLPSVVLVCMLLFKAAVGVVQRGGLSAADDPNARIMPAEDAITLTLFGFLLLFLPAERVPKRWVVALGYMALITGTVSGHRSQWAAVAAGGGILLAVALLGPQLVKNAKLLRVAVAAGMLGVTAVVVVAVGGGREHNILPDSLVKRLYAFTDPSRDPDAEWRQRLWRSRIDLVGDDWPWGRPFGARADTLMNGHWVAVPAHSAYISVYEVGGVLLCVLVGLMWINILQLSVVRVLWPRAGEVLWPSVMAVTTAAVSLAFGGAYLFPVAGPVLAVLLVFPENVRVPRLRQAVSARRMVQQRYTGSVIRPPHIVSATRGRRLPTSYS